jgi:hypothetical protein
MERFSVSVRQRDDGEPVQPEDGASVKLPLQCTDIPAGNPSQFLRSDDDQPGPLSPLGA